jgi:hypothetical protein
VVYEETMSCTSTGLLVEVGRYAGEADSGSSSTTQRTTVSWLCVEVEFHATETLQMVRTHGTQPLTDPTLRPFDRAISAVALALVLKLTFLSLELTFLSYKLTFLSLVVSVSCWGRQGLANLWPRVCAPPCPAPCRVRCRNV